MGIGKRGLLFGGLVAAASFRADLASAQAPIFDSRDYIRENFTNCTQLLGGRATGVVQQWNTLAEEMRGKTNLTSAERARFDERLYATLANCDERVVYHLIERHELVPEKKENPLVGVIMFVPNAIGGLVKAGRWLSGRGGQIEVVADEIKKVANANDALKGAFGANAKPTIDRVSKQIAEKLLRMTNGGIPGEFLGFKVATEMFIREAVRQNLTEFGIADKTPEEKREMESLLNVATDGLFTCMLDAAKRPEGKGDARNRQRQARRRDPQAPLEPTQMEHGNECVARFAAGKEFRVADAVLEVQLTKQLAPYMPAENLRKVKALARGTLATCAAKQVTPLNDSDSRIAAIKGCVYQTTLAAFEMATHEGLRQKVNNLGRAPDAAIKFTPVQIDFVAERTHDLFKLSPDSPANVAACPGMVHATLGHLKGAAMTQARFDRLKACDAKQFERILGEWMTEYTVVGGREVVREALNTHAQIKTFLAGKPLPKATGDRILELGYDPCVAKQVNAGIEPDPEKCMVQIEAAAKLVMGADAIDESFAVRFKAAHESVRSALGTTKGGKAQADAYVAHFEEVRKRAVTVGRADFAKCVSGITPLLGNGTAERVNERVLHCLEMVLRPQLDAMVEIQATASIVANTSLAQYLPSDPKALIAKLEAAGVYKTARVYATECLLKNLSSFRIENLNEVFAAREPACSLYVEQHVSYLVARELAPGIVAQSLAGASETERSQATTELQYLASQYYSGNGVGGHSIERSTREMKEQIGSNYGAGYRFHAKPEDELAAIREMAANAKRAAERQAPGYAAAQQHLQLNLMGAAGKAAVIAELNRQLDPKKELTQRILFRADLEKFVDGYVADAKKLADRLADPKLDKRQQAALQEQLNDKTNQFEAAIADAATQRILPYKASESLRASASEVVAQSAVKQIVSNYELCAKAIRLSTRTYTRDAVTGCTNHALAAGVWTAYRGTVDESIAGFFPEDLAKLRDKNYSEAECRQTLRDGATARFADLHRAHACREGEFKRCITATELNKDETDPTGANDKPAPTKTLAGSPERVDHCLTGFVIRAAATFSPLAIRGELEKFLILPEQKPVDAEAARKPAQVWHDKMRALGRHVLDSSNADGKLRACLDRVREDLKKSRIPHDSATAQQHANACISIQAFEASRSAAPFVYLQYLFFHYPDLAGKTPAELQEIYRKLAVDPSALAFLRPEHREPIGRYHQCLDGKERGFLGGPLRSTDAGTARRKLADAKVKPDAVQKAVSECTSEIEAKVKEIVLAGLERRAEGAIRDVERNYFWEDDQARALLRVRKGHENMKRIAAHISDGVEGRPAGPAASIRDVSDNFDLLSGLVSDGCVFDERCEHKLMLLESQVHSHKLRNRGIDDKAFQDILVESEFFDSIIMKNIQFQLREQLEAQLCAHVRGPNQFYIRKMIDYLTSYDYLSKRFLDAEARDRNWKPIASGRYILDRLKGRVKRQLTEKGSFNAKDPEFTNYAANLLTDYLADDWEFNAAMFWANAGSKVDTKDVTTTQVLFGYDKDRHSDWFNRVVRTPKGCEILKSVQAIAKSKIRESRARPAASTQATAAAAPANCQSANSPADEARFEALYTSAVTRGFLWGNVNNDPAQCLPRHQAPPDPDAGRPLPRRHGP